MTLYRAATAIQRRPLPGTEVAGSELSLFVRADGGVRLHTTLFGEDVEGAWRERDVERWTDLVPNAAAQLLCALVRERFGPEDDAHRAVVAYCETHGIPHQTGTWL